MHGAGKKCSERSRHAIAILGKPSRRRDRNGWLAARAARAVYNAKIDIHRANAEPIFLGIQTEQLPAFTAVRVEPLSRDGGQTGSYFVKL